MDLLKETVTESNLLTATIARLFKNVAFQNESTKISTKSLDLVSEYIRLFTQEAILRSNEERLAEEPLGRVDGIDNTSTQREFERHHEGVESKVADTQNEEDIEVPTQISNNAFNTTVELGNDVVDTRHLARVAGVLVLDF